MTSRKHERRTTAALCLALLAATFTSVMFEAARNGFAAYVARTNPGSLYTGAIAAVVVASSANATHPRPILSTSVVFVLTIGRRSVAYSNSFRGHEPSETASWVKGSKQTSIPAT